MAAGNCDLYFQNGLHCWDIAAGALLVHEAGGYVADPDGSGDFDFMSRRVLAASTKQVATELLDNSLELLKFDRDYPEKCPL